MLTDYSSCQPLNDLCGCEQMFGKIGNKVLRLLGRYAPPLVDIREACLLVNLLNKKKGFGDPVRCVS